MKYFDYINIITNLSYIFTLQDSFTVQDNKQIIRKGRERHVFLFELYVLFSKEVKDASGSVKYYIYKNKLLTSGKYQYDKKIYVHARFNFYFSLNTFF